MWILVTHKWIRYTNFCGRHPERGNITQCADMIGNKTVEWQKHLNFKKIMERILWNQRKVISFYFPFYPNSRWDDTM